MVRDDGQFWLIFLFFATEHLNAMPNVLECKLKHAVRCCCILSRIRLFQLNEWGNKWTDAKMKSIKMNYSGVFLRCPLAPTRKLSYGQNGFYVFWYRFRHIFGDFWNGIFELGAQEIDRTRNYSGLKPCTMMEVFSKQNELNVASFGTYQQ